MPSARAALFRTGALKCDISPPDEGYRTETLPCLPTPSSPRSNAINALLDLVDGSRRELIATLEAAADGRYHRRFIERAWTGTFAVGARQCNTALTTFAGRDGEPQAMASERRDMALTLQTGVQARTVTLAGAATELDAGSKSLNHSFATTGETIPGGRSAADSTVANIQAVAAEEFSSSILEISRHAEQSSGSTKAAPGEWSRGATELAVQRHREEDLPDARPQSGRGSGACFPADDDGMAEG